MINRISKKRKKVSPTPPLIASLQFNGLENLKAENFDQQDVELEIIMSSSALTAQDEKPISQIYSGSSIESHQVT